MTSLADRPNTALVVIDMQRNVVGQAHDVERVVANINALIDKARTERVPVIWVQHSDDDMPQGSEGWQYIPELTRHDDEPLVNKCYGDSVEETDLESVLSERGVGRLIVTGAQTSAWPQGRHGRSGHARRRPHCRRCSMIRRRLAWRCRAVFAC